MSSRAGKPRIPPPQPPIDVEHAAELLGRGLTYVEIGSRLGYRASSVRRRLLEAGIERPPKPSRRQARWGKTLYTAWQGMRRAAESAGIRIAPEWDSFDRFYDWACVSDYRPGLVLARNNEHGDYTPKNCRWRPR